MWRFFFAFIAFFAAIPAAPIVAEKPADDIVTGMLRDAVITPRGVLRKGDVFVFQGEMDVLSGVHFAKGIVFLKSGKKVQK